MHDADNGRMLQSHGGDKITKRESDWHDCVAMSDDKIVRLHEVTGLQKNVGECKGL